MNKSIRGRMKIILGILWLVAVAALVFSIDEFSTVDVVLLLMLAIVKAEIVLDWMDKYD